MKKAITIRLAAVHTTIISMVALVLAVMASTPASAAAYFCGTQCNNQTPSWVIPANGIQCSHSAEQIAQGSPQGTYEQAYHGVDVGQVTDTDTTMVVRVMYSTVCQTMWATLSHSSGNSSVSCTSVLRRTLATAWTSPNYGCPAVGASLTTRMVDDHGGTNAANVTVTESLPRSVCEFSNGPNQTCLVQDSGPVSFTYKFAF